MTAPFQHPGCDAMLTTALAISHAVREDDQKRFLDEIAHAEQIGGPYWLTTLIITFAALVPDDRTISDLTAWMHAS